MANLPQVPPSMPVIPEKNRRRVDIPTYSGGNATPRENLTMPSFGTGAQNIVQKITDTVTQIDRKIAVDVAQQKGKEQQSNNEQYIGDRFAFSLTGQAYKKGIDAAFVSKKEMEVENELTQLRSKYVETNNVEGYAKAAQNYKEKFLSTIPSQFYGDFNVYFDKFNTRNTTALEVRKRSAEMADASFSVSEQSTKLANRIADNIALQGVTESLIDDVSALNRNQLAQKDIYGKSLAERSKERANIKEIITKGAVRNAYNELKDNPKLYAEWKKQIAEGKWNLGNIDNDEIFAKAFPGGVTLNNKERETVIKYVDSLRSQDKTALAIAAAKNQQISEANNKSLTATGWDNFRKPDGTIDKAAATFDLEGWIANEQDAKVGYNIWRNNQIGLFVADQLELAKVETTTNIPSRIASLRNDIQQANKLYGNDPETRGLYVDSRLSAITALENEQKQRTETLKSGNETDTFISQNKITTQGLNQYQGNVDVMTQVSRKHGVSFYMVKPSKIQSQTEFDKIEINFTNKDYDGYRRDANDLFNRQGPLANTMFRTGVANQTSADDSDWAKASLNERVRRDPAGKDTKLLFNIITNYDERFKSGTGYKADSKDADAKRTFFQTLDKGLYEFDNDFGRAKRAEFNVVYDYFRTSGQSPNQAARSATNYVMSGLVEIKHKFGTTYVSQEHLYGQFGAGNPAQAEQAKTDLINQINDKYDRPDRSNLTVLGRSLDDWTEGDRDNYKVVLIGNSLRLVTKDVGSGSLTKFTVLTKRPSAGSTLFYTDLSIPVNPTGASATAYDDQSPTWEFDDTINGMGSFKEPKTVKRLRMDTMDVTGTTKIEVTEKADLDDKAIALFKHFEKNYLQRQDGEDPITDMPTTTSLYEDPFAKSLFPNNPANQIIASAISLSFKSNKGQPWMVEWLMSQSNYVKGYRNQTEAGKNVVDYWNKNFDTIKNLQTDTDTPTRMDVLQALISVILDQPRQDLPGSGGVYDTEVSP